MSAHSVVHLENARIRACWNAGAANSTTYGSFTNERILRSPTDINWVIARILVRDDADLSTAAAYGRALSVRPFDPAGGYSSQHHEHYGLPTNGLLYRLHERVCGLLKFVFLHSSFWLVMGALKFLCRRYYSLMPAAGLSKSPRTAVWMLWLTWQSPSLRCSEWVAQCLLQGRHNQQISQWFWLGCLPESDSLSV